jgi:ABC-2 type transport system ATP-binding protein
VACALAGDPDILFLGRAHHGPRPPEPPQLWDVCEAFKARGGTILLTTHFMDEAEYLADRISIMDHGETIAAGTPAELIQGLGGAHVIEFSSTASLADEPLRALPGVSQLRRRGDTVLLTVDEPHLALPPLLAQVTSAGGALTSLTTHRATLDDVFLSLTGRGLREG